MGTAWREDDAEEDDEETPAWTNEEREDSGAPSTGLKADSLCGEGEGMDGAAADITL